MLNDAEGHGRRNTFSAGDGNLFVGIAVAHDLDEIWIRKNARVLQNRECHLRDVAGAAVKKQSRVLSGLARYDITGKDNAFVRVDYFDPDIHRGGDAVGTVMAGNSHTYVKGLRSILDLEASGFKGPNGFKDYRTDVTLSARLEASL